MCCELDFNFPPRDKEVWMMPFFFRNFCDRVCKGNRLSEILEFECFGNFFRLYR